VLTVAANATGTITVTATSDEDDDQYGTATVTVRELVPTVTSVTVLPSQPSVYKGQTQQFTADVEVENGAATTVTWSIEPSDAGDISEGGLLTVSANTSATSITVKATSTVTPTIFGTTTVTVVTPSTVTSVSVSPASADVVQGKQQLFTANVEVENGASQMVTWSIEPSTSGSINDGLLTVAANATGNITVKATSTADDTKVGIATVTVTAP
jgi:hypothetical protein